MKIPMLPGMAQALQHVRAGNLKQAMAVLRHGLRMDPQDTPHAGRDDTPVYEHEPRAREAPERFATHSYRNAAGARQYKLFVPSGNEGRTLPLVVMLHGCTQSPDDFAAGTRMNQLAQAHGFYVAYPAQTQAANPKKCWNWFNTVDQGRDRGEPSLIAGIAADVASRHAVDARRVYVAGLSSGGAMAVTLATAYPDVFAAVGVHSGLPHGCARDLPSALNAMHAGGGPRSALEIPAIVFHGDRDTLVNPRNGEAIAAAWRAGAPGAVVSETTGTINGREFTRRQATDAATQRSLEHWIVHGAGHTWSGGSASASHVDPSGPDASAEMVRFFLANPKRD